MDKYCYSLRHTYDKSDWIVIYCKTYSDKLRKIYEESKINK